MKTLNVKFLEIENRKLAILNNDVTNQTMKDENGYEKHFVDFVNITLNKGDVAIDFGANIGYHTITMAWSVGNDGKVYSFEPQRIIFQQLNHNIFLNGLDNVYTYNLAIGENESEVFINTEDYHQSKITNYGGTSINTTKVGSLVRQIPMDIMNLPKLNFIKLDVQGSELNILKGGKNTIEKYRPYMFMEVEEGQLNKFNLTSNDLIEYTKNLGYLMYRILVKTNSPIWISGWQPTNDYICIPIEKQEIQLDRYNMHRLVKY
jgi:FkbM family methyltransferase